MPEPTYPSSSLPPPISTQAFYILLALSGSELHAYAIKGAVLNCSLGSVNLATGRLYHLVGRLYDEGLIELASVGPAGKSGKVLLRYTISEHGSIRLQEEIIRLNHALKIAKSVGLFENQIPTDSQRLMLNAKLAQKLPKIVRRGSIEA